MVRERGTCSWKSPSNIAIVKYWGKHGIQLPKNPSISFTLNDCSTITSLTWEHGAGDIGFYFEGKEEPKFLEKIRKFIDSLSDEMPFLKKYDLNIESSNSFPHSAGIASSASSMSALALCLATMEESVTESDQDFYKRANYIARLGSGSACRSVYPNVVSWGKSFLPDSSDEFAIPVPVHKSFESYKDAVVIVDDREKSVSSRAGHQLMNGHMFAEIRYDQAHSNLKKVYTALLEGDHHLFGEVLEEEAMTLHAMMMTSKPSYLLMRPNTIAVIDKIRFFRSDTNIPVYFTLDAGPNVHILYPDQYSSDVESFIENEIKMHAVNDRVIFDRVGLGPEKLQ